MQVLDFIPTRSFVYLVISHTEDAGELVVSAHITEKDAHLAKLRYEKSLYARPAATYRIDEFELQRQ